MSVSEDLAGQVKYWESEVSVSGALLTQHVKAAEGKVAAIADLDMSIGNFQKPAFGPVLAWLRSRRDGLVNELATLQAQVSQVRVSHENNVKMRDAFKAAVDVLAPPPPPAFEVKRKGK